MGMSDVIEQFLCDMISEAEGSIEIKRNTLANRFGCVPSQINYVIQTRFTNERGYIVESRRGGGGYVKISKVSVPKASYMMHVVNTIGESISYELAYVLIQNMKDYGQITEREGKIILSAISDKALAVPPSVRDNLRAILLKNMIVGLNS